MMPALRGFENSVSAVFLTVPRAVLMKMKCSASNWRTGRMTLIFSPSDSGNMLTIGLPRELRDPCGTSYTFSQYSRPRFEKHRM